jgi:hypothetical protein
MRNRDSPDLAGCAVAPARQASFRSEASRDADSLVVQRGIIALGVIGGEDSESRGKFQRLRGRHLDEGVGQQARR